MQKDTIKVFVLEIVLLLFLFFILIMPNIITKVYLAIILSIIAVGLNKILKKRNINSIHKKTVTILLTVFALIYIATLYALGLYFGFIKSKVIISLWSLYKFVIPISLIIISSEVIRKILLSQEIKVMNKNVNLSLIFTYLINVLIDLLISTEVYSLTDLDSILKVLGFVLFASLCSNLLYNYISIRYGAKPNIIYRLITTLYIYIIPIIPNVYILFQSFFKMLYPYLIYIILEKLFSKTIFVTPLNERKKNIFGNAILLIITTLIIMLISCKFLYGILVVGSKSMTGALNKGDAVIYEEYKQQTIEEGQVIVFNYNGIKTIHRVVSIQKVNDSVRYYTKGDANKHNDDGYVTQDDIQGLVLLRIKYIGYPTIWIKELFS